MSQNSASLYGSSREIVGSNWYQGLVCPLFSSEMWLVSKKCPLQRVPYKRNCVYRNLAATVQFYTSLAC